MKKGVVFLPIWGKQNETIPIQQMRALNEIGIPARYGVAGAFFPLCRSVAKYKPALLSLDWIHQYCLHPSVVRSLVKTLLFVLDVMWVRLFFGVPIVWTLHNLRHHEHRPRVLERIVSRFFASQCRYIRILGPGIEDQVQAYLGVNRKKIVVLPEGPYVGWYPEGVSAVDARKRLGIPENTRVWLYLGNVRPYKGIEELIEAFNRFSFSPGSHLLLIAGHPFNQPYAQKIKELVRNPDIRLDLQAVPDSDLQYYFAAADLVVLPFRNVLNSGSVLLAMGFSKAVVAPAKGLIPFRLKNQPQLLYQDEESLEHALERADQLSRVELETLGQANRAFALSYTWKDFAAFISKTIAE